MVAWPPAKAVLLSLISASAPAKFDAREAMAFWRKVAASPRTTASPNCSAACSRAERVAESMSLTVEQSSAEAGDAKSAKEASSAAKRATLDLIGFIGFDTRFLITGIY